MKLIKRYKNREFRLFEYEQVSRKVTLSDIEVMLLEGEDFEVTTSYRIRNRHEKTYILIQTIEFIENRTSKPEDVQLLNRVIRGGGFTEYVKKLEVKMKKIFKSLDDSQKLRVKAIMKKDNLSLTDALVKFFRMTALE